MPARSGCRWRKASATSAAASAIPSDKEKDPDHIGELTKIFGNFRDGETRTFTEEDAVTHQPVQRQRVVSKIFDNEDFGYHKITVERPLRLNFQASAERIARLDDESGFKNLATSAKKDTSRPPAGNRGRPAAAGSKSANCSAPSAKPPRESCSRTARPSSPNCAKLDRERGVRLRPRNSRPCSPPLASATTPPKSAATGTASPSPTPTCATPRPCRSRKASTTYFKREVLPHVPDAWIDTTKTKVGYEIPLNRHFYRYEPPRPLEVIETDIKRLEDDIMKMLKEVTA